MASKFDGECLELGAAMKHNVAATARDCALEHHVALAASSFRAKYTRAQSLIENARVLKFIYIYIYTIFFIYVIYMYVLLWNISVLSYLYL